MKTDIIEVERSTPKIVLATTIEEVRDVCMQYCRHIEDPPEEAYGFVRDLTYNMGKDYFSLVYIGIKNIDSFEELIDTIAHEATHVAQHFFEQRNERNVGNETMAYMVGNVTSKIFVLLQEEIMEKFTFGLVEAKQ